jgi:hypothetical protein
VLTHILTKSIDEHTDRVVSLGRRLNAMTAALVIVTFLLAVATALLVRATYYLADKEGLHPTAAESEQGVVPTTR